jgi:hypothetical protein
VLEALDMSMRLLARDWDEGKHPREPAGSPEGGQFAGGAGAEGSGEGNGNTQPSVGVKQVHAAKSEMAKLAQEVYDGWEQDEQGVNVELGTGGICDEINKALQGHLNNMGVETADGGQPGDEHAYTIANLKEGVYSINIPPGVYETGGGYS